ncbi:hypothetical protein NDU88_010942 [Pleurodeles waltl]|uniref:Uncharacterized protein n=1 Tax=Pleurodeles waltl TaxID=8319 RepID=A0AAV7Q3N7_PLEWA|nr:hypothetical protein NDU88_010942 [Pleurodeles waltl]
MGCTHCLSTGMCAHRISQTMLMNQSLEHPRMCSVLEPRAQGEAGSQALVHEGCEGMYRFPRYTRQLDNMSYQEAGSLPAGLPATSSNCTQPPSVGVHKCPFCTGSEA